MEYIFFSTLRKKETLIIAYKKINIYKTNYFLIIFPISLIVSFKIEISSSSSSSWGESSHKSLHEKVMIKNNSSTNVHFISGISIA